MDQFERDNLEFTAPENPEPQQPAPEQGQWSDGGQSYRGVGVGRKESPFADSPYARYQAPADQEPAYQQPADQEPANQEPTYQEPVYQQPIYQEPAYQRPETNSWQAPKKKKKKSSGKFWKRTLAAVLALALVAGSCGITAWVVNSRWEDETDRISQQFNSRLDEMQDQLEQAEKSSGDSPVISGILAGQTATPGQVYAQNVQSVVLVSCQITTSMYGQSTTGTSTGSGFVVTEDGYIITNHHVVDGATKVTITTCDGAEYPAEVIGSDETNDVAVLKAQTEDTLSAVIIGSSDALAVGDQVVAIGNPLGELTSTLTVGYVSAKERDVTTDGRTINMIQTDAAINSGNSGGPLFNMQGQVVGITTAKYSGSSSSGATIEGIGFAIPIDDVIGLVEDLMTYGYVTGAYLGVMVSDMDQEAAAYYGMPVGVYVQEVTEGYCAQAAGLRAKDIIVELGGYEVENLSDLTRALRQFKAGDTTQIVVYRSGERISMTITLDEKPQETTEIQQMPEGDLPQDGSYEEWYEYFAPFFGKGNG